MLDSPVLPGCCLVCDQPVIDDKNQPLPDAKRYRVVLLSGQYSDYRSCAACVVTPPLLPGIHQRVILAFIEEIRVSGEQSQLRTPRTPEQTENLTNWLRRFSQNPPIGILNVRQFDGG